MNETLVGKPEITGPEMLEIYHNYIFDIDGILFHTGIEAIKEFKLILKERLGDDVDLNFGPKHVVDFYQISTWAMERGIPETEAIDIESTVWENAAIYERALPFVGTLKFTDIIKNEHSKRSAVVTTRPHDLTNTTYNQVEAHYPSLKKSGVYIRLDHSISGSDFKAEFISNHAHNKGGTVFIEDLPSQAEKILTATESQDVRGILVPYGQIKPSGYLKTHPRLTILERDPETQETHALVNFILGLEHD